MEKVISKVESKELVNIIGKTFTKVVVWAGINEVSFETVGKSYVLYNSQDGNERCVLENFVGNSHDLLHSPVTKAEGVKTREYGEYGDMLADRFHFIFGTEKGEMSFYFSVYTDDDYYSTSVDFREEDAFYY